MWFNVMPFFVQVIIFVIIVRIIVGAVNDHNRRAHVRGGCCQSITTHAAPVATPAQVSVAAPAVATEIKQEVMVPVAPETVARYCPSCGAQRTPTARFCTMCGSELA